MTDERKFYLRLLNYREGPFLYVCLKLRESLELRVNLEQLRITLYLPLALTDFCNTSWAVRKLEIKLASAILQDKIFSRSNGKKQPFFLTWTKSTIQDVRFPFPSISRAPWELSQKWETTSLPSPPRLSLIQGCLLLIQTHGILGPAPRCLSRRPVGRDFLSCVQAVVTRRTQRFHELYVSSYRNVSCFLSSSTDRSNQHRLGGWGAPHFSGENCSSHLQPSAGRRHWKGGHVTKATPGDDTEWTQDAEKDSLWHKSFRKSQQKLLQLCSWD